MLKRLRGHSSHDRLLHRLHSVVLVAHGLSASEVARIYGDSPRAVSYWVKRFNKDGAEGLEEEVRPGRPSKLGQAQMNQVRRYVERYRTESKRLNAQLLSDYIIRGFGVKLTLRQCWRILKQFND